MPLLAILEAIARFVGIAEWLNRMAEGWQATRKAKEANNVETSTNRLDDADTDRVLRRDFTRKD